MNARKDVEADVDTDYLFRARKKIIASCDIASNIAIANARLNGKIIGFTNGCFDILHVGHLAVLEFSKAHCDFLIVGLNSDASVKRLKGKNRPINSQEDRALLIGGLNCVDLVAIFDDDTPLEIIKLTNPNVLIKGDDYTIDRIVGAHDVIKNGGHVITCRLLAGKSTTGIIKSISEILD